MDILRPLILPYLSIFDSPLFIIFTLLSAWQAWQGLQLGQIIWRERPQIWQEPLTNAKMRLFDSAAFLLAIPPSVFIHELGHAIAVWAYGGRVLEFGFFFFWGYVLPDRRFFGLQEWVISSTGPWASLLCAAALGLLWYTARSNVVRYFAQRAVRLQIFFSLIYYPLFTLGLSFGDWRTIYDFSLAPVAATITAVLHVLILVVHVWADRRGVYEQPTFASPADAQAFRLLAQKADADPTNLPLQDQLITELWRRNANREAQRRLKTLLHQHPQWGDGRLTAAVMAAQKGSNISRTAADHAAQALQHGLTDGYQEGHAHRILGLHYIQREKYATAQTHLEQAIERWGQITPEEPIRKEHTYLLAEMFYSLGVAHLRQRQPAAARTALEQALPLAQRLNAQQLVESIQTHLRQV
jgi:tetratricopeptide (TPR) repeat protein